jgi:NAD(P)-dependent dehydrogenase (short-subunit alcohol dehydrogenase family)
MSLIYKNKFCLPSLPPPGTFKDQTILITGASGGLGLATAVHFVNLGASSVIITARSNAKGEAAKTAIEAQTGTEGKGVVKSMELDMSTLASTKAFAERVKQEVKKIDYVLLNAGLLNPGFKQGKEGFEESIQVNVLSTALLGLLLLPWMKEAGHGKAHLGFVTSGLHRSVAIDQWPQSDVLSHFSRAENWPKSGMYATSKLLEQYVVREIAKLALGNDGRPEVIVNPICPGKIPRPKPHFEY